MTRVSEIIKTNVNDIIWLVKGTVKLSLYLVWSFALIAGLTTATFYVVKSLLG